MNDEIKKGIDGFVVVFSILAFFLLSQIVGYATAIFFDLTTDPSNFTSPAYGILGMMIVAFLLVTAIVVVSGSITVYSIRRGAGGGCNE